MNRSIYAAAMLAVSAAAFLPMQSMAQVGVNIVIGNAPPPPRFENTPPPRHGYVWAPGYWNWNGNRHVWADGHWERERGGYQYRRPEWVQDGGRWRLDNGGWIEARREPDRVDYVRMAPPPPRHEPMPRPRAGYVWSPGHWDWDGRRHQWSGGTWIAERPGYIYSPAAWQQRDGRWYQERGGWAPRGGPRGDRDHDGVPNRNDRDRDGDGVPNRFDDRPDNPRRH